MARQVLDRMAMPEAMKEALKGATDSNPSQEKIWHAMRQERILTLYSVERKQGLSAEEVRKRLETHGPNALPEKKRHSIFIVFLRQFKSPLIYLLLFAAAGALLLGELRDSIVILVVVLLNSLIGAFQEGRAEGAMEALRQISSLKTRVLRDAKEQIVPARDLVPGDILLLAAGDAIGADARLIEAASLEIAEAALTGESVPVEKKLEPLPQETLLADRLNMAYAGTHVTAGRGVAVVVAIGLMTEVGKISELTQGGEEPKTPLEIRIAQFGRYLIYAAGALFFVIIGLGRLRQIPFSEIFMIGVSQVVSMIPEGLPVAVTIALAVGVQRMAARKAIVRRLSAVETLGSTSVICSDKTGTLTRNEMTVTAVYLPDGREIEVTGIGYVPEGEFRHNGSSHSKADAEGQLVKLIEAGVLCNDSQLLKAEGNTGEWKSVGDPTEVALLTLALKAGVDVQRIRSQFPRVAEIPFESGIKMMATRHARNGDSVVYVKGAVEVVLDLCQPEKQERENIQQAAEKMASHALRVLAIAGLQNLDGAMDDFNSLRGKVRFLGLIGQLDPPREEAKEAVAQCQSAGIRPVMVTGDHKTTGWAIAHRLGIATDKNTAIDGAELERLTDDELSQQLDKIAVFARVHPAQKLRIVEAYQARKYVVAMTGDGVNDAPALARANVGVAMGISGTEVAKEASKIVIMDDNFATLVTAVAEGRLIYRNIKKLILYLFSTSSAEIIVLISALAFGYPPPLAAVQILWINLVTDGAVTVTLIIEPAEGDEMRNSPIPLQEPLLTTPLLRRLALLAPAIALSTLGLFVFRLKAGVPLDQARTEAFTVLAVSQWYNVLNCRSDHQSVFRQSLFRNKWLMAGLTVGVLLQALVVYWSPLNVLFHTVPLPPGEIVGIVILASLVVWVEELRKVFVRRRKGRRQEI